MCYKYISLEPLCVKDWDQSDEPVQGSRRKMPVLAPGNGDDQSSSTNFFIFKYPKESRKHEIWSELLASYIAGDMLEWDVQHVSLAQIDSNKWGNLLKYFYKVEEENFLEGRHLCLDVDDEYDVDKGQRHTLSTLQKVNKHVKEKVGDDFVLFWARAFALDCLISNTDRHADNWGFIRSKGDEEWRMAPLFDNATSLDCGRESVGLNKVFNKNEEVRQEHLEKMAKNGCHHVRADAPCKRGSPYVYLCGKFMQHSCPPELSEQALDCFRQANKINIGSVKALMVDIQSKLNPILPKEYQLSDKRVKYIIAMLEVGVQRLYEVISSYEIEK